MQSASRRTLVHAALVVVGATAWAAIRPPQVDRSELVLRANEGRVTHDGSPFTGVAVRYDNGALVERVGYRDGKKDGLTERWHLDGTRSERTAYAANHRHGTAETWWPDGTPRSEAHFAHGVADGVQREWYRSGALFKEVHLADGQEAGLQRAWRENGALYANYEARDGRIYGLKRANLCYELDDEQLVVASNPTAP